MSLNKPVSEGLSPGTPHKGCKSFLVGGIMRAPSTPSKAQTDTTLQLKISRHGLQQTTVVSVKSCGCWFSAEPSHPGNVGEPRQCLDRLAVGFPCKATCRCFRKQDTAHHLLQKHGSAPNANITKKRTCDVDLEGCERRPCLSTR